MNSQHKVCLHIKSFRQLEIFIDNKVIKVNNSNYVLYCSPGKYTIKIKQYKMIQSKYYWIFFALNILFSLLSGDIEFDGKTPFYAIYEAEIYIDKDININAELYDANGEMRKSKHGFCYEINVQYPNDTKVKVVKNEFTATTQEKNKWLLYFVILWTIVFGLLLCIFVFSGINLFRKGAGVSVVVLLGALSCFSILGWIFTIYKYYKWSRGKY